MLALPVAIWTVLALDSGQLRSSGPPVRRLQGTSLRARVPVRAGQSNRPRTAPAQTFDAARFAAVRTRLPPVRLARVNAPAPNPIDTLVADLIYRGVHSFLASFFQLIEQFPDL